MVGLVPYFRMVKALFLIFIVNERKHGEMVKIGVEWAVIDSRIKWLLGLVGCDFS